MPFIKYMYLPTLNQFLIFRFIIYGSIGIFEVCLYVLKERRIIYLFVKEDL